MLARQAAFPYWCDTDFTSETYVTQWSISQINLTGGLTAYDGSVEVLSLQQIYQGNDSHVPAINVTGASATQFPSIPIGIDAHTGSLPWVFMPSGWSWGFSVGNVAGNYDYDVQFSLDLEYWDSPGELHTVSILFTANAGFAIGYYQAPSSSLGVWVRPRRILYETNGTNFNFVALSMYCTAGTAVVNPAFGPTGLLTVSPGVTTSLYPGVYPSELINSQLPWASTRLTAAACLFTNVSQVLYKSGTVLAGRVSPTAVNPWLVDQAYVNSLHPAEKAWLPLETGLYTYVPPSTDMASFWDYTINVDGYKPVYRLDNDALVNVAFLTPGSVGEVMAVTTSWHMEFRTSSALFQIALCGMPIETLHSAQLALAAAGYFFENPEHTGILSKLIAGVKKVTPYAIGALSAFHPIAGGVAQAAWDKYNAPSTVPVPKAASTVPPTSLAKALPPPPGKKKGVKIKKGVAAAKVKPRKRKT